VCCKRPIQLLSEIKICYKIEQSLILCKYSDPTCDQIEEFETSLDSPFPFNYEICHLLTPNKYSLRRNREKGGKKKEKKKKKNPCSFSKHHSHVSGLTLGKFSRENSIFREKLRKGKFSQWRKRRLCRTIYGAAVRTVGNGGASGESWTT
jgi:hypothetical protein